MHNIVNVTESVYWIGVNDRKSSTFENYMPLPMGITYNSFILIDEKTCLIDAVEIGFEGIFMKKLEGALDGRDLDYLIINHMEPDHSGSFEEVLERYPNAKIVGNAKTFPMLKAFFENVDESRFLVVKEGDILDLGKHKLQFVMMPMVHWPETMATYDITEKILFSSDAFGSFGALNGGIFDDEINYSFYEAEARRYYANIVGKYGLPVQNVIKKLKNIEIDFICPAHGILWRSDIARALKSLDYWSRLEPEAEGVVIVYGTMYGNTSKMAHTIATELSKQGIKEIVIYDASKTDHSFIISEIWKYKGLIIGTCTHNSAVYPKMQPILSKLKNYELKNRYVGVFGNKMWCGGGLRDLIKFTESLPGIEVVGNPIEAMGDPTEEDYDRLEELARTMASKLKGDR